MSPLHILSIALIYFSAAVSLTEGLTSISLYVAIPIAFLFSFSRNLRAIRRNKYFVLLLIMYAWSAVTSLGAEHMDRCLRQFNQILGVILLCCAIINLSSNKKTIPWLYGIYIILSIAVLDYIRQNLFIMTFDIRTGRIGDAKLDSNTIAYYTFYLTCSLYILGQFHLRAYLHKICRIAFLMMIPVSFLVAIYTASRQVLIIQIPLIALLIYIRYFWKNKRAIKYYFGGLVVASIAVVSISDGVQSTYDNSYLKQRSERSVEDDPRARLLTEAFEVGIQNPLFGVGPGNFAAIQKNRQFSHCSYTELFANSGILAVSIYVYILLSFVYHQYRNYRKYHEKIFIAFFVIGIIFIFYNFFYVFYIDLWLMSFFALITSHAIMEKRNERLKVIRECLTENFQ